MGHSWRRHKALRKAVSHSWKQGTVELPWVLDAPSNPLRITVGVGGGGNGSNCRMVNRQCILGQQSQPWLYHDPTDPFRTEELLKCVALDTHCSWVKDKALPVDLQRTPCLSPLIPPTCESKKTQGRQASSDLPPSFWKKWATASSMFYHGPLHTGSPFLTHLSLQMAANFFQFRNIVVSSWQPQE